MKVTFDKNQATIVCNDQERAFLMRCIQRYATHADAHNLHQQADTAIDLYNQLCEDEDYKLVPTHA